MTALFSDQDDAEEAETPPSTTVSRIAATGSQAADDADDPDDLYELSDLSDDGAPTTTYSGKRAECGICSTTENISADIADRMVRLQCGHHFCLSCLVGWYTGPHCNSLLKTCPYCKKAVCRTEFSELKTAYQKARREDAVQSDAAHSMFPFKYRFCDESFNDKVRKEQVCSPLTV